MPAADFNPEQAKAIEHRDGHLLIVAGPGTGKTFTLTHKIARLLEAGLPARELVAITFTTKAAQQLCERLEKIFADQIFPHAEKDLSSPFCSAASSFSSLSSGPFPFIGTFHAYCLQLLRHELSSYGPGDFEILAPSEQNILLSELFPQLKAKDRQEFQRRLSLAKNKLQIPPFLNRENPAAKDAVAVAFSDVSGRDFEAMFEVYVQALEDRHLLDFDDLLLKTIEILENVPEARKCIHQSLHQLLIDEYQDMNEAQYRFVRLLVGPQTTLTAIGDPDQAIYGFRGSDLHYFLRFEQDFHHANRFALQQNYRSTPSILAAANRLIRHNTQRLQHEVRATSMVETPVQIFKFVRPWQEADFLVKEISRLVGGTDMLQTDRLSSGDVSAVAGGYHFADVAVLYRTKAQGFALEKFFQQAGIPYQMPEARSWHDDPFNRLLLSYLHWLLYQDRTLIAKILAEKPFGLDNFFGSETPAVDFVLEKLHTVTEGYETLNILEMLKASEEILRNMIRVGETDSKFSKILLTAPNAHFLQLLILAEPFRTFRGKEAVGRFLEAALLEDPQSGYDERLQAVSLMTLHAAKGLEFPIVFIGGLEDGLFPAEKSENLEEERRLFYVGLTRAREQLYLTFSARTDGVSPQPSRFLTEIGDQASWHERHQPSFQQQKKIWKKKQLPLF